MQKKLIAMAVAGLVAAPAFAQVTISGRVDGAVTMLTNDKDSKMVVASGQRTGSRLTIAASEDLGGGLKGLASVEIGFNVDNGTGAGGNTNAAAPTSTGATDNANGGLMFNRQAQVGIAGGFGQVMIGRAWTPTHLWGYATALMPQGATAWEGGYKLSTYTTALSNSIEYTAPKLGPVEIRAQYGFAENSRSDVDGVADNPATTTVNEATGRMPGAPAAAARTNKGSLALGARASFGPANLFLGLNKINTGTNGATGADVLSDELAFGGNVNLGMVQPFFHLQKTTVTSTRTNGGAESETSNQTMSLGAKIKVGAKGFVAAQFSSRTSELASGADGAEATGMSVSYEHDFSKRTKGYVAYGNVGNDKGGTSNLGYATKANEDSSLATVGMVHYF